MGLMHITGHRDGPPAKVGVAITDLTTGLYTCNSVLAALLGRVRTGRGQHIDVSLADCQIASLTNIASSCLVSGRPDTGRWGTAHPSIVPYRAFRTRDGDLLLGGGNDRLFGVLCEQMGRPQWTTDVRFRTNADRVRNRDVLERLIDDITRTKTTAAWLAQLEGAGLPYAPINDVQTTLHSAHGRHPPPGPHLLAGSTTEKKLTACSPSPRASHGDRGRASRLRASETREPPGQVLRRGPKYPLASADSGATYG